MSRIYMAKSRRFDPICCLSYTAGVLFSAGGMPSPALKRLFGCWTSLMRWTIRHSGLGVSITYLLTIPTPYLATPMRTTCPWPMIRPCIGKAVRLGLTQ